MIANHCPRQLDRRPCTQAGGHGDAKQALDGHVDRHDGEDEHARGQHNGEDCLQARAVRRTVSSVQFRCPVSGAREQCRGVSVRPHRHRGYRCFSPTCGLVPTIHVSCGRKQSWEAVVASGSCTCSCTALRACSFTYAARNGLRPTDM